MKQDVEHQLFQLDDFRSDAAPLPPPVVGIEFRVVCRPDKDNRGPSLHRTMERPAQTAGMVRIGDDDHRAQLIAFAPAGEGAAFVRRSVYGSRDPLDLFDTHGSELARRAVGLAFVRNAAPPELEFPFPGRIREEADPPRDPAPNQIGGLENAGIAGVDG